MNGGLSLDGDLAVLVEVEVEVEGKRTSRGFWYAKTERFVCCACGARSAPLPRPLGDDDNCLCNPPFAASILLLSRCLSSLACYISWPEEESQKSQGTETCMLISPATVPFL